MTFQTGDVVRYKKKKNSFWKGGAIHIIYEVSYEGKGQFSYSTNRGAWFKASDFSLVRKADKESFAELDKSIKEEYEDYE